MDLPETDSAATFDDAVPVDAPLDTDEATIDATITPEPPEPAPAPEPEPQPEPPPEPAPAPEPAPVEPPVEAKCRRPDFEEGREVVLADGNAWHIRRPRVYFRPADNDTGFESALSDGDTVSPGLRKALDDLGPRPLIIDLMRAELKLARHALERNYDLAPGQAGLLLHFAYPEMGDPDPDAVRIRDEVMAVLNGQDAPKAEAGGAG